MLPIRLISSSVGIAALTALTAPALWSHSADAADRVRHHGSECLQMGTDTGAFDRSEFRITRTGRTGSDKIICPVGLADDAGRTYLDAYINDSHSAVMACTLQARDIGGNLMEYNTKHTGNIMDGGGDKTMSLVIANHGYNVRALVCKMPANYSTVDRSYYTKLFSYRATVL